MSTETTGLIYDQNNEKRQIEGFTAKCSKCGSENVSVHYEFKYWGGMTGYDLMLKMQCRDCDNNYRMID